VKAGHKISYSHFIEGSGREIKDFAENVFLQVIYNIAAQVTENISFYKVGNGFQDKKYSDDESFIKNLIKVLVK
jgi:hypothetical protein